jgi:hypothetical protein
LHCDWSFSEVGFFHPEIHWHRPGALFAVGMPRVFIAHPLNVCDFYHAFCKAEPAWPRATSVHPADHRPTETATTEATLLIIGGTAAFLAIVRDFSFV